MKENAAQILIKIEALLDGQEWDADTCTRIAELLLDNGYTIRDPSEVEA